MKTLYILPYGNEENTVFYLVDIDTGEVKATHFCSNRFYAKGDLLNDREARKEKLEEAYGEEVTCEFFNAQSDVTEAEFEKRNSSQKE